MIPIFATFQIVSCAPMRAMWTCPECGRSFANRNQSHFCSQVRLEDHFAGRDPNVVAHLSVCSLQLGKAAGHRPARDDAHCVPGAHELCRMHAAPAGWTATSSSRAGSRARFRRVDFISPRNQVHVFRIHEPYEVDAEAEAWLDEAYSVGQQHHLSARRR
jgi:hypothetical protein